jgi:hypothetical protein
VLVLYPLRLSSSPRPWSTGHLCVTHIFQVLLAFAFTRPLPTPPGMSFPSSAWQTPTYPSILFSLSSCSPSNSPSCFSILGRANSFHGCSLWFFVQFPITDQASWEVIQNLLLPTGDLMMALLVLIYKWLQLHQSYLSPKGLGLALVTCVFCSPA